MPPRETTAAQPLVLLDYAATGTELCARQRQLAAQLAPVLERLMQSCTEYAIGVGEFDLVGRMQRSADTNEHTHDQWLRSVAEAFLDADTGVVTTTAQEMIAALADAPAIKKANIVEELAALETAADRFAYVQNTYPDLITHQNYPTNEKGVNAHIMMDPPASELMLGTRVDYGMNIGNSIYSGDLRIRSFVINDPSLRAAGEAPSIYEGPSRWNWHNAEWTVPGTHLLVYEVTFGDEPPQYYTMEQTIVEPTTFAAQRLAEQSPALDAEMYLLSLTMMLEQAEQLEGADPKQIEQLVAALANAEALLAEGGTPLPAVLVMEETSQTLPLNLFVQETAEGFALIDLTNPHPDAARTYRGDTLEAAWADFVENNTLPAGQLAATPPTEHESSPDLWNVHSNGRSTLEEWSNGLGIFSAVGMGAGIVLLFVPGGQFAGALILAGSLSMGAVSTGLSMADRAKYGNMTWNTQTQLEVLDLLATGFVGTRLVGSGIKMTAKAIGTHGVRLEILETGADVTSTFLISKVYYEEIERINQDTDISAEEKQERIRMIVQQALVMGGLVAIGGLPGQKPINPVLGITGVEKRELKRAINKGDIDRPLRSAINNSAMLQQIVIDRNYDLTEVKNLWQQWKSMQGHVPHQSFDAWVTNFSQHGIPVETMVDFYNYIGNIDSFRTDPVLRGKLTEHPEFIVDAMGDPELLQYLSNHGSSVFHIVDAGYTVGLDVQASKQLIVEAAGFKQVEELGDLAADGTLTNLRSSGFDDQTINRLLGQYNNASLRAMSKMIDQNLQPHRALEAIKIADETGLRGEVVRHVNSGNLQHLPGLAELMEGIRNELRDGKSGKLRQLEEAMKRANQGHLVAVETKEGDVIDYTAQEVLQIKTLTSPETKGQRDAGSSSVVRHLVKATEQFTNEIPPVGYKKTVHIRIENDQNYFAKQDYSRDYTRLINDLKADIHDPQKSLKKLTFADEIRIIIPSRSKEYILDPNNFQ